MGENLAYNTISECITKCINCNKETKTHKIGTYIIPAFCTECWKKEVEEENRIREFFETLEEINKIARTRSEL